MKPIKVANVIDDYTLVLNVGFNDGIEKKDCFLIYAIAEEIIDPDTGKSLGKLELVKGRGVITHIQENICTIKSTTYHDENGNKKIVRRIPAGYSSLASLVLNSNLREEIIESNEKTLLPFENPLVGDIAKII